MGEHVARGARDEAEARAFTRAVLEDLRALEALIAGGGLERGVRRVGVEQEMFLVDGAGRPATVAEELLDAARDPRLTTELARFNLEANLPPRPLGGPFLRRMEEDLLDVLAVVTRAGDPLGARPLLVGILPTLARSDLSLGAMARAPRYAAMNDALTRLRGGKFAVALRGLDALQTACDSIMLESANTSFQLHLQVDAEDLAPLYNLAQLITAPLLAAAVGSPLLFGKRLWHETRVALFERATDARSPAQAGRGLRPRVSFGDAWVRASVLEMLREDALRYPVILVREMDATERGGSSPGAPPNLGALRLHNGTVWRWNRPCYGVADGKAHLRIENRALPAGPTVLDEVANAALFYGLMEGLRAEAGTIPHRLAFEDARASFFAAARHGLDATLTWLDGRSITAVDLLENELFAVATRGLEALETPAADVERYLGTARDRVRARRTPARLMLDVFAAHRARGIAEASLAVTRTLLAHQASGAPAHAWPETGAPPRSRRRPARSADPGADDARPSARGRQGAPASPAQPGDARPDAGRAVTVGDVMTTDVFTVRPEDLLDLAAGVMTWRHVRHVPVEDAQGRLLGLVSPRALLEARALPPRSGPAPSGSPPDEALPVEALMDRDPVTVPPTLPLREAARLLLEVETGCLLVVQGGKLAGIATERDLLRGLLAAEQRRRAQRSE